MAIQKKAVLYFLITTFGFATAGGVLAFDTRTGTVAAVRSEETIDGSVLISGKKVSIDGTVNGDVFCAGQDVEVSGTISGDLICASQTLNVTGKVAGNVRAAAQTLDISGTVAKNIAVAGQKVASTAAVGGDALVLAQDAGLGGEITRDAQAFSDTAMVSGRIGRNAAIMAQQLTMRDGAAIGGNLDYTSQNEMIRENGIIVGGMITRSMPVEKKTVQISPPTAGEWLTSRLRSLAIYLVLALLLVSFFEKATRKATDVMLAKPARSLGVGLLILLVVPIIALALLITIIGIPVSLIFILVYALAIVLSRIIAAIALGRRFAQWYWKNKQESIYVATIIGIIACWLAFSIPAIGGILIFTAILWGLGGIYYFFRS